MLYMRLLVCELYFFFKHYFGCIVLLKPEIKPRTLTDTVFCNLSLSFGHCELFNIVFFYCTQIVFKVQLDPAKGSFVALDDVTVAAGACPYTGRCDFEAHQCTWTNSQADDFDWIQANGHFSGPSVDHTTQTPEGKCNPSKPSTATQLMHFVLYMFLVLLLNLKS